MTVYIYELNDVGTVYDLETLNCTPENYVNMTYHLSDYVVLPSLGGRVDKPGCIKMMGQIDDIDPDDGNIKGLWLFLSVIYDFLAEVDDDNYIIISVE